MDTKKLSKSWLTSKIATDAMAKPTLIYPTISKNGTEKGDAIGSKQDKYPIIPSSPPDLAVIAIPSPKYTPITSKILIIFIPSALSSTLLIEAPDIAAIVANNKKPSNNTRIPITTEDGVIKLSFNSPTAARALDTFTSSPFESKEETLFDISANTPTDKSCKQVTHKEAKILPKIIAKGRTEIIKYSITLVDFSVII